MADTYTITSQSPDVQLNSAGTQFEAGWKIGYKVTSGPAMGASGTLFVSNDNHNAADVGAAIASKISDLAEIAQLGS